MEVTINTQANDATEMMTIKKSLQTLAKNVTKENLKFLAELSEKPGINEKLQENKGKINFFL